MKINIILFSPPFGTQDKGSNTNKTIENWIKSNPNHPRVQSWLRYKEKHGHLGGGVLKRIFFRLRKYR